LTVGQNCLIGLEPAHRKNALDRFGQTDRVHLAIDETMNLTYMLITLGGIALCVMALAQFALWSTQSLGMISQNRKQFQLSQELLRKQIESVANQSSVLSRSDNCQWSGYRTFRVHKLVQETAVCTSVYLKPDDGKPIPTFEPGQHLTFKFAIPGEAKPVVRCYSLSDQPGLDYYRISVKAVPAPHDKPNLAPGRASNFINHALMEGDKIEVKSPSGHFVLDEKTDAPIVLLGGGIGITPMVSIVNHLIENNAGRLILLVYGVRNSADHAFKSHFEQLSAVHENFHVVNCYSHPNPTDVEGKDFQIAGFASATLLKQILPNNECQFYMCGPPPFMESIYNGLLEWEVPESRIFFEAFGPASIGKKKSTAVQSESVESGAVVKFVSSDVETNWDSSCESILEMAESNDVMIDSGCRAGSCGTCETTLLSGTVKYPENQTVDCPPGKCLVCIAKPDGPIELDA